jgi:tRNA-dihydrouridine synthase A
MASTSSPQSSNNNNEHNNNNNNIQRRRQEKVYQLQRHSKLQLAPMMEYTDRHFRHVVRLISNRTLLYTEMVSANSLAYERRRHMAEYAAQQQQPQQAALSPDIIRRHYQDEYLQRSLRQGQVSPLEGASVLQLGGSDPQIMKEAAETVMDMTERNYCDYTALNLNCGCPSPKVAGKGCFGAALMDDPQLVAELTQALHEGCDGTMPISVKCRIGTDTNNKMVGYDDDDDAAAAAATFHDEERLYETLCRFIETVASNGIVTDFGIHARIAVLTKSFSPADNRKIPPLKYHLVHRLVEDYPDLTFTLNGGIDTLLQAQEQFEQCPNLNGVMIGRAWAADPWSFAMADHLLYGDDKNENMISTKTRLDILEQYGRHADQEEEMSSDPAKVRRFITKAVTTLFTGEPNAKRYRIALDEIACMPKKLLLLQASQGPGPTTFLTGQQQQRQPPLSELILNAAHTHLSEEVLLRTPQESWERKLYQEEEEKRKNDRIIVAMAAPGIGSSSNTTTTSSVGGSRSSAVAEWQSERHREQGQSGGQVGAYEAALSGDDSSPFAVSQ